MYTITRYEYSNVNGEEQVNIKTSNNPPAGFRSGRNSTLPDGFNHLGDNYVREYRNVIKQTSDGGSRSTTYHNNRPTSSNFMTTSVFGDQGFDDFDDKFNKVSSSRSLFWENDTSNNLSDDRFAGFSKRFGVNTPPSASQGPEKIEVTSEIQQIIQDSSVKHHNTLRELHQDTRPLYWDSKLAKSAQQWAEILATDKTFKHSNENGVGENLYMFSTSEDIDFEKACETAVQSWYSEIKNYDLKTHWQTGTVGHFTQVVWKDTTKLGVGVCKMKENGMTNVYVVGRYSPPGNFVGKYRENVKVLK